MSEIHPTAVIAPSAVLAANVQIGPYTVIHDNVHLAEDCVVGSHTVIHPFVKIGRATTVADHVVLGGLPQDISFEFEDTWVVIGENTIIREFATIHRSTNSQRATTVGDGCYLMVSSHIGHDCQMGDNVILTGNSSLSGHVTVDSNAIVGGHTAVHQFCRIGSYAMVGGFTAVSKDVLPFSLLGRDPVAHYRLNTVGLRRAGIKGDRYRAIEQAFRLIRDGKKEQIEVHTEELKYLESWLSAPSKRGMHKFIKP